MTRARRTCPSSVISIDNLTDNAYLYIDALDNAGNWTDYVVLANPFYEEEPEPTPTPTPTPDTGDDEHDEHCPADCDCRKNNTSGSGSSGSSGGGGGSGASSGRGGIKSAGSSAQTPASSETPSVT